MVAAATAGGGDKTQESQVSGRLVGTTFAEFVGGMSGTIKCQHDAVIVVADGRVTEVRHEGERSTVEVGDNFDLRTDDRPGVPTPDEEPINVYVDDEGQLHSGCDPESIVHLDDGRELTLEEFDAEMEAKYGSPP